MMQMPGSKTKPDGSVPLVTEDYKMRHSERKKKRTQIIIWCHRNDADAQTMQVRISASAKKKKAVFR